MLFSVTQYILNGEDYEQVGETMARVNAVARQIGAEAYR